MKDHLTPEDRALWDLFGKGVERLKKPKADFVPLPVPPRSSRVSQKKNPLITHIQKPRRSNYKLTPLEPRQLKRIVIDGHLDLHGHKLEQAEVALHKFMITSQKMSRQWVLIISGKGLHSAEGRGTLKRFVQEWFHQNAHLVIGFTQAKTQHGGMGAFYVKVRRLRTFD